MITCQQIRNAQVCGTEPLVTAGSGTKGDSRVPTKEVHLKERHEWPEIEFDWDEANIGHLARHSVLPEEAEQVILNDPVDLGMEIVEGEERYLNLGATVHGRVLLVVTTWREDRVRVVTAFEPIKRLIQFYYQERER